MTVLRYGYTVEQVGWAGRVAALSAGWAPRTDGEYTERYEVAWGAIAEYLYAVGQAPTEQDLVRAGRRAILDGVRADMHCHGVTSAADGGIRYMPAHEVFWRHHAASTVSAEDLVISRLATRQILAALSDLHRETLLTLAAHDGSPVATARALGVTTNTIHSRTMAARTRFSVLWHEHETPVARVWRRSVRRPDEPLAPCGTPAAYTRHRARRETPCEACRKADDDYRKRLWAHAQAVPVNGPVRALGARLRQLRTERGMSLVTLGRAARVSSASVYHLEVGHTRSAPHPDRVKRLDEALGAGGELVAMAAAIKCERRSRWTVSAESPR